MDRRIHQIDHDTHHAVDCVVVLEAPRRQQALMRREAGNELDVEHLENTIAPGINAVAAHTKRHGALVCRRELSTVRNFDLWRIA